MLQKGVHILQDFFFPTEQNGMVPFSLSRLFFFLYSVVAGLFFISTLYFTLPFASFIQPIVAFDARDVIRLTNQARIATGLQPLLENSELQKAAEIKARDMLERQYFSHTTPDNKDPWSFIYKTNYQFSAAGENLAVDFYSANEVHAAWMNSTGHRANILNGRYKELGVAVLPGNFHGSPSVLVVQFFGDPKVTSIPVVTAKQVEPQATQIVAVPEAVFLHTIGFNRDLYKGTRGTDVKRLQRLLSADTEIYPEGAVTGFFGEMTERAVERFQKKHEIVSSGFGLGYVGKLTKAKLAEVYSDAMIAELKPTMLGAQIVADNHQILQSIRPKVVGMVMFLLIAIPVLFLITRKGRITPEIALRALLLLFVFGFMTIYGIGDLLAKIDEMPAIIEFSP